MEPRLIIAYGLLIILVTVLCRTWIIARRRARQEFERRWGPQRRHGMTRWLR